jgi:NAD(P)-dependent dehydrogenase (short-subunit alcohol dehydrogenase family)
VSAQSGSVTEHELTIIRGIGKAAALHLAKRNPARLILAVRNEKAGQVAAAELARATEGQVEPEVLLLDMSSFATVRRFVQECEQRLDRLDVFVSGSPQLCIGRGLG